MRHEQPTPPIAVDKPSVAVIGAGILGASAAYHLARAGATVTIFERAPAAAAGVTAKAFGWVGAAAEDPSKHPELFRFRLNALSDFDRLDDELQGKLVRHARGALIWKEDPESTTRLVRHQSEAGAKAELVSCTGYCEARAWARDAAGGSALCHVGLRGRSNHIDPHVDCRGPGNRCSTSV